MEASESGAQQKAEFIINRFQTSFYSIVFTLHPVGIPGEIRGKASNVKWAASQMYLHR